jgi:hypothetical protein
MRDLKITGVVIGIATNIPSVTVIVTVSKSLGQHSTGLYVPGFANRFEEVNRFACGYPLSG